MYFISRIVNVIFQFYIAFNSQRINNRIGLNISFHLVANHLSVQKFQCRFIFISETSCNFPLELLQGSQICCFDRTNYNKNIYKLHPLLSPISFLFLCYSRKCNFFDFLVHGCNSRSCENYEKYSYMFFRQFLQLSHKVVIF